MFWRVASRNVVRFTQFVGPRGRRKWPGLVSNLLVYGEDSIPSSSLFVHVCRFAIVFSWNLGALFVIIFAFVSIGRNCSLIYKSQEVLRFANRCIRFYCALEDFRKRRRIWRRAGGCQPLCEVISSALSAHDGVCAIFCALRLM